MALNESDINLDGMTVQELLDLRNALEKLKKVEDTAGIDKWFIPYTDRAIDYYPKHKLMFDLGSEYRERVFMAGNRIGKTVCGGYETACHLTGLYPSWWKGRRFNGPIKAWVAGKDKTTTRDTIQKELFGGLGQFGTGMIPASYIERTWSMQGVPNGIELAKIKHVSGGFSELGIKSYDRGVEAFMGTAMDCVTPDTEVLTKRGWTAAPEAGDTILSYVDGRFAWSPVNWVHREHYSGKMYKISSRNNFCANVTAGHRWLVYNKMTKKTYMTRTDELKTSEQLVVCGSEVEETEETYSNEFVQLIGWLLTDGSCKRYGMNICQSSSYNPGKCLIIESLLDAYTKEWKLDQYPYENGGMQNVYRITGRARKELLEVVGREKSLPVEFINRLSTRQRHLLLESIILGDGMYNKSGSWSITSKRKDVMDSCQYLATLCGYRTLIVNNGDNSYKLRSKASSDKRYNYNRVSVDSLEIEPYDYSGEVYCPNTNYGTAVFRTNGREVFLSGQCVWLDEECPEDVYGECLIRTMTTNGIVITTFTPKKGLTPLLVTLGSNADMFGGERYVELEHPERKQSRVVIQASWADVPHLDEQAKHEILSGTPVYLRKAVTEGIPAIGEGLVYPVDRTEISYEPFEIPSHYKRWYGLDVGWNCTAAVFFAEDPDSGIIYVTNEYRGTRAEPIIHAQQLKIMSQGWMMGAVDPASHNRGQGDGKKLIHVYRQHGLKLTEANNAVNSGIANVWEGLSTGKLKIAKHCHAIFREMMLYRVENGQIKKVDDHCMDALRYGFNTRQIATRKPTGLATGGGSYAQRMPF